MAYDANGRWKQEDDGVANRIAKITASTTPYMTQARTGGMQTANRRGLGNSSMAVQAGEAAAIGAAAPIAGQEAAQIAQKNLAEQDSGNQTDRLAMQLSAAEREMQARAVTDLSGQRYGAYAQTLANPDIPAATRAAVQKSINDQHDAALAYLEQLYGVRHVAGAMPGTVPPAPAPGYTPTGPVTMGLGGPNIAQYI